MKYKSKKRGVDKRSLVRIPLAFGLFALFMVGGVTLLGSSGGAIGGCMLFSLLMTVAIVQQVQPSVIPVEWLYFEDGNMHWAMSSAHQTDESPVIDVVLGPVMETPWMTPEEEAKLTWKIVPVAGITLLKRRFSYLTIRTEDGETIKMHRTWTIAENSSGVAVNWVMLHFEGGKARMEGWVISSGFSDDSVVCAGTIQEIG